MVRISMAVVKRNVIERRDASLSQSKPISGALTTDYVKVPANETNRPQKALEEPTWN